MRDVSTPLDMTKQGLADRYAQLRDTARVRERALFLASRIPNELELQARWFAGDFGTHFVSTAGDKIDIVQFGTWNREAGPDFRDAAIKINGSDPIRGCIELVTRSTVMAATKRFSRRSRLRSVTNKTNCRLR